MHKVERFDPKHFAEARPIVEHQQMMGMVNCDHTAETFAKFPSATLRSDEGEIIACGGIVILWKGVGEAWGLTTKLVEDYRILYYKTTKTMIEGFAKALKLHRVQATVPVGHEPAARFIIKLGFAREGLLKKFGPDGSDFIMFGRLF